MSSRPSPELRPLPLNRTIRWLPDNADPSARATVAPGIVAAVELLVVERGALRDVELHIREVRVRAFGVLLGAVCRCPNLRLDYLLVEGALRGDALTDAGVRDAARRDALAELIARIEHDGKQAVGWYRCGAAINVRGGTSDVATHAALFTARWTVALLRQAAEGGSGAFVRLSPHRRPYLVPFYELLPLELHQEGEPARTAVTWANYRTDVPTTPIPEVARTRQTPAPFSGPSNAAAAQRRTDSIPHPRISGRVAPFVPQSSTPISTPVVAAADLAPPASEASPPPSPPSPASEIAPTPATPTTPAVPTTASRDIDRMFDDPPPPHLAGNFARGERRPRAPIRWRDETTRLFGRRRRPARIVTVLIAVAIAGTWSVTQLVDRGYLWGRRTALGSAAADTATPARTDSTPANPGDSAAAMARFAAARLDESMINLDRDLRLVAAALDTTGYGKLAPGACAVADSAHTRSLLDADAIALAQRYLTRPLDNASHRRIVALMRRADLSTTAFRRACP